MTTAQANITAAQSLIDRKLKALGAEGGAGCSSAEVAKLLLLVEATQGARLALTTAPRSEAAKEAGELAAMELAAMLAVPDGGSGAEPGAWLRAMDVAGVFDALREARRVIAGIAAAEQQD